MAEVAVWLALRGLDSLDYSYRTDATECLRVEMRALADLVNNPGVMMLPRDSIKTNLFEEMRELAYAVEDMVDDLLPRRRGYKKLIPPSLVLFPRRTQVRGFANKVREIRLRVEEYERSINGHRYGLDIIRPTTPPPPPPIGLVGLDHHVSLICQQVLLATSPQWPLVVTIVGMTGIGKTTLAGLVFDNLEIKQKFEVLVWVSLNTNNKLGGRFKMITGSSEYEEVLEDYDGLSEKVRDLLQGRHYLIVLDHVIWRDQLTSLLHEALRPAVDGSCVLVTTPSIDVAQKIADEYPSTPSYELPLLNQEQSMELLQRYMGGGGEEEDCSMDVESVHTLLKICGGLPLALNKVGVMLHNSCKQPGRTYRDILKELEAPGNNIMDELLEFCLDAVLLPTSYINDEFYPFRLSFYKRACYLYLASLCKDGRIVEASKLIRLWAAEGFISYDNYHVDQTNEDAARDLLDLMLHFSMIQPVHHEKTDLRRSIRDFSVTIHPIYHDLCVRENNRDDNRLLDAIAGNLNDLPHINNPRRLVLYDLSSSAKLIKTYTNFIFNRRVWLRMDTTTDATADNIDVTTLRSLLIASTKVAPNHLYLQPITWLKYLRVIDLVGVKGLSELPDDIGDTMITLRYLGLRKCSVLTKLPSSVGALPHLQTLDIRETGIQQLPKKLGAGLRHLLAPDSDIGGVDIIRPYNLDTLAVDDCEGWLLEDLLSWSSDYNIRSLSLKGLGRLNETPWVELARTLGRLKKMENLYLHAKDPIKISTLSKELSHLNKLRELYLNGMMTQELIDGEYCIFPRFDYITVLTLDGSKLVSDPMPALGELPSLEHLTLKNDAYTGREMMCASTGGFPSLKCLQLWCLRELKVWIMHQPTLSNLNFLSIGMCESLGDLPEDLQYSMASLREVEVIDPRDEFLDKLRYGWKDWNKINMHALSIKLWRERT